MTYKQMYDHLAEDYKKVLYRKEYYLPKAVKEFRKTRIFPAWKWYEYEVPESKNQYVIFYYAANPGCIENPDADFFVNVFFNRDRFVIKWLAGAYMHTPDSKMILLRQIHGYTSHFLHRYAERFIKNESLNTTEIACRYLSRNKIGMPIEVNEDINRNIEKYGEGGKIGFRVKDGMCFVLNDLQGTFSEDGDRKKDKVDAIAIIYKTFVTESMMTDHQQMAIEKEHIEKWTNSYLDFLRQNNGEEITLTLEP